MFELLFSEDSEVDDVLELDDVEDVEVQPLEPEEKELPKEEVRKLELELPEDENGDE